jgi:murein DD-endopeptidase MepM/ murein hydrolase activator NlpD
MKRTTAWLVLIVTVASTPIAYFGWQQLYRGWLETIPPIITVSSEGFHGIGLTPVKIRIDFTDDLTGLDEIILRVEQKNESREVLRKSVDGAVQQTIYYEFPGLQSQLEEGSARLEIQAFDRSFWSNGAEQSVDLKVDYRKPRIEVLTTQHNVRYGGAELVLYRSFDEDLQFTGVRVGNRMFEGYPAKNIDKAFEDPNLYVALFAVPLELDLKRTALRVVAIDGVGNTSAAVFYNKIMPRAIPSDRRVLEESFLRDTVTSLFVQNLPVLEQLWLERTGYKLKFRSAKGSRERLIEQFELINQTLREYNDDQIFALVSKDLRTETLWKGPFMRPGGSLILPFGTRTVFSFEGKDIGSTLQHGYELRGSLGTAIHATNDGVIVFSDALGIYGRSVAIDHGMGLVSFYGRLNNVTVSEGDLVKKGQVIGALGETGFSVMPHLYFEMRLHGIPIDPNEWWDARWIRAHIEDKIVEVKKQLGITRYEPIE